MNEERKLLVFIVILISAMIFGGLCQEREVEQVEINPGAIKLSVPSIGQIQKSEEDIDKDARLKKRIEKVKPFVKRTPNDR